MIFLELAFITSLVLIAYTFAGYPVLLAVLARVAPRPVSKSEINPTVDVVIVVNNGMEWIERKIRSCLDQDYPADRLRVLVVSDGSEDRTCAIVDAFPDNRVELISLPQRRGKAACLNDAFSAATADIVVLTDVRQSLHPQALRQLVNNFSDGTVGAVSGQLVFEREGMTDFGEGMDAYWRYEKFLRRTESRVHSCVGVTGALYAIRRECFREISPQTILDDVLIPMNVVLQGYRVVFEDAALAYDRPSRNASQERVRKVRTLAGNFQLLSCNPVLLAPWRNPVVFQLVSHKLMRLLVPPALALALVTNALLLGEGRLFLVLLMIQLGGYALAGLGAIWHGASRIRLVKLAFAFVSLNWFVVLGFVEFISNRNAHLWKTTGAGKDGTGSSSQSQT